MPDLPKTVSKKKDLALAASFHGLAKHCTSTDGISGCAEVKCATMELHIWG
jgi:hypothetical protein